jgi:lipopolysaccharide biosynthesis glycosyltransferase
MVVGNISILWRKIQEQYYRDLHQSYSSLHWTRILIQNLWQVTWDQLDHQHYILHQQNNLVTLAEAAGITTCVQEELAIVIQGILSGNKFLFQEHYVAMALN